MIVFKYLNLLEEVIRKEKERNECSLKAVEDIKLSLRKIDFNVEEIALTSEEKFISLLSSLKGTPLTGEETEIARRIVKIKKIIS